MIVSSGKSGSANPATWIDDGEKYALIGLSVKVEDPISLAKVAPHLSVLADTKFDVPPHWREWLGSIRTKEVEQCHRGDNSLWAHFAKFAGHRSTADLGHPGQPLDPLSEFDPKYIHAACSVAPTRSIPQPS